MHYPQRRSLALAILVTTACGSGDAAEPDVEPIQPKPMSEQRFDGRWTARPQGPAPSRPPMQPEVAGSSSEVGAAGTGVPEAAEPAPDMPQAGAMSEVEDEPPVLFSYAVSNVDADKLAFGTAPAARLNCGVTRIDTSAPVTLSNWCGTSPAIVLQTQAGGTELVVLTLDALEVSNGSSVVITGARPIAFVVRGDVNIVGRST